MLVRTRPINLILLFVLIFLFIVLLYSQNNEPQSKELSSKLNVLIFDKWNACMRRNMGNVTDADKFWSKFQKWTDDCDSTAGIDMFGMVPLQNSDETKYGLLPVEGDIGSTNNLVTLGIGKDIDAEKALKMKMLELGKNITFYGADPITDVNAELYAKIGKYFPFAVGGDAGYSRASVYVNGTYMNQDVVHVDLVYFLDRILKIKTYDHIWLDAEYAEYGVFDAFYKGGRLDEKNITFCQMSLEVHQPNDSQKTAFMHFIKTLIEEERYGFFKNYNVGHMRMWLFNFDDQYCVKKFIQRRLYE